MFVPKSSILIAAIALLLGVSSSEQQQTRRSQSAAAQQAGNNNGQSPQASNSVFNSINQALRSSSQQHIQSQPLAQLQAAARNPSPATSSNDNQAPVATGECGPHHACENGGTCLEDGSNFTCACPTGFTGPYCAEDVNECALRPHVCLNGATCLNKPGGYQCICVNGWTGPDCGENVDDCTKAACENGATCHDHVGRFYCECPPGKTGLLCQLDDGCYHNPCHPNATCDTSHVDGHPICTCPAGFTGRDCSIDIDECEAGSPCEHGGSCVNTPGSFRCECPRGFTGSRCEINIDECENNPCMNDGTCLDDNGAYRCICMPGFAGSRCEVNVDDCASNPCHNGATCKDLINSFRCICRDGHWGERCEYPLNNKSATAQYPSVNNKQQQPEYELPAGYPGLGAGNPWANCPIPLECWTMFNDGKCDQECYNPECLYDGTDCSPPFATIPNGAKVPAISGTTSSIGNTLASGNDIGSNNGFIQQVANRDSPKRYCDEKSDYCLKNYANGVCDQECNNAECGWDGSDCESPITPGDLLPPSTQAQGLLVIRVEPPVPIGPTNTDEHTELAKLLRRVSVVTKTILKIQNYRHDQQGTEIELIADNRKCQQACYNSTALIANFLKALKERTKEFPSSEKFSVTDIRSQPQPDQQSLNTILVVSGLLIAAVATVLMVVSGNNHRVKEKAVVWFPEGFKPVLSSRQRDPTNRRAGRGVSTLQALGGNFFRGIKRNERHISSDPNGVHSTDVDQYNAPTPNGGAIYHEPYDQYDQYGTYNGTDAGSVINNVDEPMTPTPMPMNPINMEGPHGFTPLMVASMKTPYSKEPLGLVAYGTTGEMNGLADNNVTDLLQRGAQLNLANKDGETALHLAARHGRVDAVRGLLERCDSQDVNARDSKGRTPLHAAIAANRLGPFELLIRCRGTDLNAQTNDGTTPLIEAVRKCNTLSMIEELILNECDVTKSDAHGKTALHWAAVTDNVDAVRRLLAVRETNKDAQDLAEETPLFLAAREGARAAVELLLSHNANKDIKDQMDQSPLDIARSRHHEDIVRLLSDHEPTTPRSAGLHHSSRQVSPFSPLADSNSNGSSTVTAASTIAAVTAVQQQQQQQQQPPPSYHTHSQSNVIMPATPESLTNSLSPVSCSYDSSSPCHTRFQVQNEAPHHPKMQCDPSAQCKFCWTRSVNNINNGNDVKRSGSSPVIRTAGTHTVNRVSRGYRVNGLYAKV